MKIFEKNNLFGLKNDDGTVILPTKFYKDFIEKAKEFSLQELVKIKFVDIQYKLQPNGTYIFTNKKSKEGLKKYNSELVVECKYDWIYDFESNGLAVVGLNNKHGLINERGEVVVKCKYDWIYNFQPNGLVVVELNNKQGFMNEKGKEVAECKYDWINDFQSNGLAVVELDKKLGLINEKGEIVVECK